MTHSFGIKSIVFADRNIWNQISVFAAVRRYNFIFVGYIGNSFPYRYIRLLFGRIWSVRRTRELKYYIQVFPNTNQENSSAGIFIISIGSIVSSSAPVILRFAFNVAQQFSSHSRVFVNENPQGDIPTSNPPIPANKLKHFTFLLIFITSLFRQVRIIRTRFGRVRNILVCLITHQLIGTHHHFKCFLRLHNINTIIRKIYAE